jgi:DNA polymerase III gamma/tau subunit
MSLHDKYRPENWDQVFGQSSIVKSLRATMKRGGSQCLLFSSAGPGLGKTSMARLAALEFGCTQDTIMEHDAASFSGIDSMRQITSMTAYAPLGGSNKRAVIIDEAHGLSKQAWDSLLKATEEPPAHMLWIFCTTNVGKVPATIKSRATAFELKPVGTEDMWALLDDVCVAEKIKLPDNIRDLVVASAQGSPRQLLVDLEKVRDVADKKEAAQLLHTAIDTDATLELARFLTGDGSWPKAMAIVNKFGKDENWEGVRIVVSNYLAQPLKKAKNNDEAVYFLRKIEAFSQPYNPSMGISALLQSIGQAMFN